VAALTGESESSLRIGTSGNPESSLITIYADGQSPQTAEFTANSTAAAAVSFLKENLAGQTVARFPLDHSAEGWDSGAGIYLLPPERSRVAAAPAHSGAGALEVTCRVIVAGGCGPYLALERPVFKSHLYEASGWVQAARPTTVRLVMGSTPADVAVGETVRAGGDWRRISVQWIPHSTVSHFVVAVQIMALGAATLRVDDFEVGPRTGQRASVSAPSTGPPAQYETVVPATSAAALGGRNTGVWATAGAAAGLLIAIAALAAARSADRRRQQSHPGRGS
jgi:hypothetical protein